MVFAVKTWNCLHSHYTAPTFITLKCWLLIFWKVFFPLFYFVKKFVYRVSLKCSWGLHMYDLTQLSTLVQKWISQNLSKNKTIVLLTLCISDIIVILKPQEHCGNIFYPHFRGTLKWLPSTTQWKFSLSACTYIFIFSSIRSYFCWKFKF